MTQHQTKTSRAMALVNRGMNPYAAAREVGLTPGLLYKALAKLRKVPCPCCGQLADPKVISTAKQLAALVISARR